MRTFETTENYYHMIFNIYDNYIETHNDRFDSVEETLIPEVRSLITPNKLKQMGCRDVNHFIEKMCNRDNTFHEITGAYRDAINKAFEENRGLYRIP